MEYLMSWYAIGWYIIGFVLVIIGGKIFNKKVILKDLFICFIGGILGPFVLLLILFTFIFDGNYGNKKIW